MITFVYVAGEVTSQEALREEDALAEAVGGLTVIRGVGTWTDNGKTTTETVHKYEVVHNPADHATVLHWAENMRRIMGQKAVLVVTLPTEDVTMVGPDA